MYIIWLSISLPLILYSPLKESEFRSHPPVVGQGFTGNFSLVARIKLNYHFTGIMAYIHFVLNFF